MITTLTKLSTRISLIQDIPTTFFRDIESATSFDNNLFPPWAHLVFNQTSLFSKFRAVYVKYKSIKTKSHRNKIVSAFAHNNRIEDLCQNDPSSLVLRLDDLPKSIRKEIDVLFLYLYNTAINYHQFETYVNDTLKASIDRFVIANGLEVCPFCGLEGFLNIEGQSRIALDHWLCKDLFPMSAVNFDNLFPIGAKCNERPAKGSKNILIDSPVSGNRVQAFYPYLAHHGITSTFNYLNEPSITGITDSDWELKVVPNDGNEQAIFNSWNETLNIKTRYLDYVRKIILPLWESDYKRFIDEDHDIDHANNINELKANFRLWKASFPVKGRPGAILYRCFIDCLIQRASNAYLFGLCENFRR